MVERGQCVALTASGNVIKGDLIAACESDLVIMYLLNLEVSTHALRCDKS